MNDELLKTEINVGYQIFVVNIKYGKELNNKHKERPDMVILDIPESIRKIKNEVKFRDNVESFAYNTITRKYGAEVCNCQVWLPLAD
jgi:hypothetical protein